MLLTIQPQRLYIASLQKEFLPSCSYVVMKLILFAGDDKFFSMTETDEEVSLVLSEEPMKLFSEIPDIEKHWNVWESPWIAIHVLEGSSGFTSTGVVHALSDPLAKAGISIFNISTTESDFTLVPEERVYDAIDVLEERFQILTDGLEELTKRIPRPSKRFVAPEGELKKENRKYPLSIPPFDCLLCSFKKEKEMIEKVSPALLKVIFFPKQKRRFFSYTESEDEISIVFTSDCLEYLKDEINDETIWKPIKVDDGPLGFAETGIVCSLVESISTTNINLFYLSTFFTDYLLVESENFEKAFTSLSENFKDSAE